MAFLVEAQYKKIQNTWSPNQLRPNRLTLELRLARQNGALGLITLSHEADLGDKASQSTWLRSPDTSACNPEVTFSAGEKWGQRPRGMRRPQGPGRLAPSTGDEVIQVRLPLSRSIYHRPGPYQGPGPGRVAVMIRALWASPGLSSLRTDMEGHPGPLQWAQS